MKNVLAASIVACKFFLAYYKNILFCAFMISTYVYGTLLN